MKLCSVRRVRHVATALMVLACCVAMAWLSYVVTLGYYSRAHIIEVAQRSSFYALTLKSQLARYESLPRLAALQPVLRQLLTHPDDLALRMEANAYLKAIQTNAELSAAYVMDIHGDTLAASNSDEPGSFIGSNYSFRPYFIDAINRGTGRFYGVGNTTGEAGYFLAVPVSDTTHPGRPPIGAVAIKASLDPYEAALSKSGDFVLLVDRDYVTFLASVPAWRYRALRPLPASTLRKLHETRQYGNAPLDTLSAPSSGPGRADAIPEEPGAGSTLGSVYVAPTGRRAEWYRVVYRPVGPLGWKVAILVDPSDDQRSALFASISAAAGTALVFALIAAVRLRHSREKERQRTRRLLLEAQRDIEQRIAERTAELTLANAALNEKVDALDAARRILRDTRDTAIQAGKLAALGQMAAGITHELNQPLAAIMTLSSNAVRMTELGRPADLKGNLVLINDLAARMGKIVAHVKGFARHEAILRESVPLAESLRHAVALIEAHRNAANVTIRVEPVPQDAVVWASSIRIEQVFVNLLANAVDASAAAAKTRQILVTTKVIDKVVQVSVADSGNGIPSDVMPRLFEPFFTTKQTGKGLGLGLAISQAIVDEFGGRLFATNSNSAASEFGGAVFTVELLRVTEESLSK